MIINNTQFLIENEKFNPDFSFPLPRDINPGKVKYMKILESFS